MGYASLNDFQIRLGYTGDAAAPGIYDQLTDRTTLRTADNVVGQQLLESGQGKLDSILAKRYRTPIDTSTDVNLRNILRQYTLDVAEHLAWQESLIRRRENETTKRAYLEALAWAEDVAAGRLDLPAEVIPTASASAGFTGLSVGSPRVTTDSAMEGLL